MIPSSPPATAGRASVPQVPALDGITVSIDGRRTLSETIAATLAPHVLVLTTTLPDRATTLTSTYVGHPSTATHATHLELGPGIEQLHTRDHDHDSIPVTHALDRCLLDHAFMLQELAGAQVDVTDTAMRGLTA